MAGVEFDRQVFIPTSAPQGKSTVQVFGPLLLVLALGVLGYVGYKVYLVNLDNSSLISANAEIQQLQQQLTETQKRLETVEKHRRATAELPPKIH